VCTVYYTAVFGRIEGKPLCVCGSAHQLFRARICKRFWSPGIDSEELIPAAFVVWRAGTTNKVVLPARRESISCAP
jgi:hypothetical protein